MRACRWSTHVHEALRTAGVTPNQFVQFISPWIAEPKRRHIETVASKRLAGTVCVIEGLYDLNNVGAITRSAEAFGITDICIINIHKDRFNKKKTNASVGAGKWVGYSHYTSTEACLHDLRNDGFHLAAAHRQIDSRTKGVANTDIDERHSTSRPIVEMVWPPKSAVIFGNDFGDLSGDALTLSDTLFHIPTTGFAQSLSVTATAAITFHELSRAMQIKLATHTDDDDKYRNLTSEAEIYARLLLNKGVSIEEALADYDGS
eukprot:m.88423 g.88423  ORF g.88423 m.88423 type:complete len:261 (+) comp26195_c2_seq3:185-967(+)